VASLTRTPSLTRDLSSEWCKSSESSSSSSVVAALARSLSRPPTILASRVAVKDDAGGGRTGGISVETHQWPSQMSQTLPRSYKLNGGAVGGGASSGGPQLATAWRDAVAKASNVLSRSSSRSSLKTETSTPAPRRFSQPDEPQQQLDFTHTLPKSYTQLRSAMADNQLLVPRTTAGDNQLLVPRTAAGDNQLLVPRTAAGDGKDEAENEDEQVVHPPPVQTVLTVQV